MNTLNTLEFAVSMGLAKVRESLNTINNLSTPGDNAAISSPVSRTLPPVPDRIASNSNMDINVSRTGTCPMCRRNGIYIVNTTGLLRVHGPHKNRCKGSGSHPQPGLYLSARTDPQQSVVVNQSQSSEFNSNASTVTVVSSSQPSLPTLLTLFQMVLI